MADVKWIKITTDVFDDDKILLIESLPEADSIIVIWFKLLCLAGKQNNSGVFIMGNKIAYTDKMLATIFRRKESTVQLALRTFEQFGMIELVDGIITIPNWGKHQSLDQLESKKTYMQKYMKEYRRKQKALTAGESCKTNSKTNSKANVSPVDKKREEREKDKIKEEEREKEKQQIVDLFNSLCPSFPKVKILSDSVKSDLEQSLTKYSTDNFKLLFKKAEVSSFLKGENDRKWTAPFDWLIKEDNIAKVLNGNFDDKTQYKKSSSFELFEKLMCADAEESEPAKTVADSEELKARVEAVKKKIAQNC